MTGQQRLMTLVLVFLSWAASANAQSVVIFCFGTTAVCASKIGTSAVVSARPQESQVLLADNFRWEAPLPLAKAPQIPVMIARNELAEVKELEFSTKSMVLGKPTVANYTRACR